MSAPITGAQLAADGALVALVSSWGVGCLARGDKVRDWWARTAPSAPTVRAGSAPAPDHATQLELCAHRLIWDAPAAGEYPRPLLEDSARVAMLWPELAAVVWHHAAGATILGGSCECVASPSHPAGHRDALISLGRALRVRAASERARAELVTT